MINHAMFQCNGRSGYVLKPPALRMPQKNLLSRRTNHFLDVTIISAQQLPRPKDSSGREIIDKSIIDPFIEVSIHVPDWSHSPSLPDNVNAAGAAQPLPTGVTAANATSARTISYRTSVVKNNGFNPVWQEDLRIPFDCVGDMKDLIFVRFAVKQADKEDDEPLALYCASLGSLQHGQWWANWLVCMQFDPAIFLGFRHLPLHDAQLSQYLFSTLFVQIDIRDVE
jgi:C2 domain.